MRRQRSRDRVPLLVAHRGYASRFPENTLPALDAALASGACFVEIDIQMTADCEPVLLHDADLHRTGNRSDRVLEMSKPQVMQAHVGYPEVFGEEFVDVRVPSLRTALDLVARWPRAQAFVEVKPQGIRQFGAEKVLDRILVDLGAASVRPILISSVIDFLVQARRLGHLEIGLVLTEWSEMARSELHELQPDYVFCNLKRIPEGTRLWPGSWRWVIYEVVSPTLALEWAGRGADLIETMAIGEMLADPILARRSCLG